MFDKLKSNILICGGYGAGKTCLSVNLALHLKSSGNIVTLIDLDTVNPYFRAADAAKLLTDAGVRCIIPEFAGTNVDVPSLPPEIASVFGAEGYNIFDVGGDDTGATPLGVYRENLIRYGYDMIFVASMYRPLTRTPFDALEIMRDIEFRCGLRFTKIVNNSSLGAETTSETVKASFGFADELSRIAGIPLLCDSVCEMCQMGDFSGRNIFRMTDHTKKYYGDEKQ